MALPGQVIELAGGRYPPQLILADPAKKSAKDVVFRPKRRAPVFVERINLGAWNPPGPAGASHVTFGDLSVNLVTVYNALDITLKNLDARSFYLGSARNVLIKGGDYGPCTSTVDNAYNVCQNSKIDLTATDMPENRDITIDGVKFHDYRIGRPGDHWECLMIFSGRGITIRNSMFSDCEFFDILLEDHRASPADRPLRDVVLENNWFEAPWNGQGAKNRGTAVAFSLAGTGIENVLIRSNSFDASTGLLEDTSGTFSGLVKFRVERNLLGRASGCAAGIRYVRNLRTDQRKCSPADDALPWGYEQRGKSLRPIPAVAGIIRRIFSEAARGVAPAVIAARLREKRAPSPPGAQWTASTIQSIARNPSYRGNRYGARGAHPAIVSRSSWRAVQGRLSP